MSYGVYKCDSVGDITCFMSFDWLKELEGWVVE